MKNSPIIIAGVPRSGGGIIAQILDKAGVYSGGIDRINSFENRKLQNTVVRPYFRGINADVNGQYPLPVTYKLVKAWDTCVEEAIDKPANISWFVKDSKALLIWKVWDAVYPDAKWIIARRRTGDIINSCIHTSYMNAFESPRVREAINVTTVSQGWKWWVHKYEECILEMFGKPNVKIIYPERILQGDLEQLFDVLNWANVEVTEELKTYIQTFKNKDYGK